MDLVGNLVCSYGQDLMSLIWEERGVWEERHEMSIEEIAGKIGCSKRAVKQALSRGMQKLRDGRATKIKELVIAREREANHGLPRIVKDGL